MTDLPPYRDGFDGLPGAAAVRAQVLDNFRLFARYIFANHVDVQSVMVCIAQYWNDEADDAIHSMVMTSHRRTPVWPHHCIHDDPWSLELDQTFGDLGNCCQEFYAQSLPDYFPFPERGGVIPAFEPYCSEEHHEDGFRPYAVARRTTGDDAEVELLAVLHRPHLLADESEGAAALDERATALLLEAATELGPRHVLADYLLARGDPRGEYLALALAPALDAEGRARRDQLLAEHGATWLAPLGRVVPRDHAVFERGLLAAVSVFADLDALRAVEGSPGWSSVERLHFLPGSADLLPVGLRALREVGPLSSAGLAQLATGDWPHLETLWVSPLRQIDYDNLQRAKLPRLRSLVNDKTVWSAMKGEPAWWRQLERLTFVGSSVTVDQWLANRVHSSAELPWVASSELGAEGQLAGWEIAASKIEAGTTSVEVRMRGWHPDATRRRLIDLLDDARPLSITVVLVPSAYWAPTDDDVRALGAPGRTIAIATSADLDRPVSPAPISTRSV